jgi:hypothetical protein
MRKFLPDKRWRESVCGCVQSSVTQAMFGRDLFERALEREWKRFSENMLC